MNWQWLIIAISIALVVGGMAWVRPSPRQSFLAKLRMQALQQGYKVAQIRVSDTTVLGRVNDESIAVIVYRLFLSEAQQLPLAQGGLILRTSGESGIYLPDGWTWADKKPLSREFIEPLCAFIAALLPSVTGIELNDKSIGLIWNERADISEINAEFEKFKTALMISSSI